MMTEIKVDIYLHLELFLKCITRYMADKSDLDCGDSTFQAAGQVIMYIDHACIVPIHVACVLLCIKISSQE